MSRRHPSRWRTARTNGVDGPDGPESLAGNPIELVTGTPGQLAEAISTAHAHKRGRRGQRPTTCRFETVKNLIRQRDEVMPKEGACGTTWIALGEGQ